MGMREGEELNPALAGSIAPLSNINLKDVLRLLVECVIGWKCGREKTEAI